MCADVCIHDTKNGTPHAHIMLTMRPFKEHGEWGDKQKKVYFEPRGRENLRPEKKQYKCKSVSNTDWNEPTKVKELRIR
jgi:hypothetical protein